MLLTKLTRGNQVTLPKIIVDRAHLRKGEDFLYVEYINGVILLKPVDIEERIPGENHERFIKANTKIEKDDILVKEEQSNKFLRKRLKKK